MAHTKRALDGVPEMKTPKNSQPDVRKLIRDERLRQRLSQKELANKAGCAQSAVSMFEQGQPAVLSDEKIRKLADVLGIELGQLESAPKPPRPRARRIVLKCCPDPLCISNVPYFVRDKAVFVPAMVEIEEVDGHSLEFCSRCGEALIDCCPECKAPLMVGPVCPSCGKTYVCFYAEAETADLRKWVQERVRQIKTIRKLTKIKRLSSAFGRGE